MKHEKNLQLPSWIAQKKLPTIIESDDEKMRFVLSLCVDNIKQETGGPFSAAVFDDQHNLIAVGVNRVVPNNCSSAHAEVMALTMAQETLGRFDLGENNAKLTLVSSARMCIMCYGAVIWSGVRKVIVGATSEDVMTLTGFDEGPHVPHWRQELEKRGIEVVENVLRNEACDALRFYKDSGGIIYNGRS